MPYLGIQTNRAISSADGDQLVRRASALVARGLGKPESYVMVAFAAQQLMLFAGSDAPCAYLELKSIGLSAAQTADLSRTLCQFMNDELAIQPDRTYIEFSDARASYWGWDGGTF